MKTNWKKFLLATFLFTFIFSFGVNSAFATEIGGESQDPCVADFSDFKKSKSKMIKSESGNDVYEIKDFKQAAEEMNIPLEQDGEELVGLAYSYTEQPQEVEPTVSASALYLKITSTGEACGQDVIRSSYYQGPSEPTMTITESVSATYTSSVGVDAKVVSSSVGFSVTSNFTVSDSYKISVPAGKTYNVKARPIYLVKNFEVWNDPVIGWDTKKGSGYAMKPVGVCFAVYK
jgi:hypothetical protein